ncbi:uncharacterized protein Smp_202560 [Schistosoma mansoni]|uniref:uncharacterized protein n=1 Tax=Schistosoma mansoni TaxID=6183 RepID=UPI00022DC590|nr:uncharacterized protein Smp_202560 [Schistosoma mansoni]|eukprot:XP_018652169.1 uncharacterized protein Smp_202560 [Schistosoma mansoni]
MIYFSQISFGIISSHIVNLRQDNVPKQVVNGYVHRTLTEAFCFPNIPVHFIHNNMSKLNTVHVVISLLMDVDFKGIVQLCFVA